MIVQMKIMINWNVSTSAQTYICNDLLEATVIVIYS